MFIYFYIYVCVCVKRSKMLNIDNWWVTHSWKLGNNFIWHKAIITVGLFEDFCVVK